MRVKQERGQSKLRDELAESMRRLVLLDLKVFLANASVLDGWWFKAAGGSLAWLNL